MKKSIVIVGGIFLIFFCDWQVSNAAGIAVQKQQPLSDKMAWWRESRFGMFIHWGLYSILEGEFNGVDAEGVQRTVKVDGFAEWIMHRAKIPIETYERLLEQFNPRQFDAEQWVGLAKQAGMKYLVLTAKHHDGFCLWPTKMTDYNIARTPYQKDVLAQLAEACKKHGIRFCLYYSILDWHHPDYLPRRPWDKRPTETADFDRYVAYMKAQLKELIEWYDPALLWFDGEWEPTWTHERGKELYHYLLSLKPDLIINNRVDKGRKHPGGFDPALYCGDFGTPEQEIPAEKLTYAWESCMTINKTWGFSRHDEDWKSADQLIRMLCDIAGKGGNLLLNVGPTADGVIPEATVVRLVKIGQWLSVNGEAIYGTRAGLWQRQDWGASTQKTLGGKTIHYLHLFRWPDSGAICLPGLSDDYIEAAMLATGQLIPLRRADGVALLDIPAVLPDSACAVIKLSPRSP